ncbi:MAG: efflux RND transporter periplasmic adaptor subunit, partial [Gemmobacter sp.]|nr:efflux RND transporter periplasmic adaptor subunit [Gemmobacter sp.]
GPAGAGGGGGGPMVIAQAPGAGRMADSVTAIGDGRSLRSVSVVPETPGRVTEVPVQSGQRIEAGQLVARLDSEAEEIALERARLVLDDARARVERVLRLRGAGASTDVQTREAELALRQAELALRQAEFDLAQRQVLAPIAGWVGILNTEVGAQVGTSTELAQIDDRSVLLVDFRLPERMVGRVAPGDPVAAQALATGHGATMGKISAIDNRVDPASRTLRVQAMLDNADDRLRAGMSFSIQIDLPGEAAPSVDPLSVQWSREGAFVWVVREGRAARLPVRILQRSETEVLVDAAFLPGDLVIVEGVQAVRPGAPVRVQGREGGTLQPASGAAVPQGTDAARL